ncbi:hypothetical protein ACKUB1_03230 [Methanospirillum stamsii]|uniref:Uncharacterized protein n=2 Tax=Methanospirillum stamsii TaxID=1277351 RepID=A0A2V2N0K3_9EURY|nr:hypothetical protein DLD82_13925 [Methanospirillum stamsii]
MGRPEILKFTPFDRLTDDELREAMLMHIKMGYILKFPGKSKDADEVVRDIVNKLSIEDMKKIHPDTFFTNKPGSERPRNPYELAIELIGE